MDRSPRAGGAGGLGADAREASSPKDRRCATCHIKLSMYNQGPHCWQHTIGWPWKGPTAKPTYR